MKNSALVWGFLVQFNCGVKLTLIEYKFAYLYTLVVSLFYIYLVYFYTLYTIYCVWTNKN